MTKHQDDDVVITHRSIADYTQDPKNARVHNPRNLGIIEESLQEVGTGRSMVADEGDVILAGNGTIEAAGNAGITKVIEIETDGDALIVHKRRNLTPDQKVRLAIADNLATDTSSFDAARLKQLQIDGADLLNGLFRDDELADLFAGAKLEPATGQTDADAIPADRAASTIQKGDRFQLGRHVLLCGDSKSADDIRRVLLTDAADLVVTDPPYCSGGFQEAGKASGSIGTRSDEMIHNDTLSTRGYQALLTAVLGHVQAKGIYIFTDWRMWTTLFDIAEACGQGVRNMVVWDKGTPGMGAGWRSQHELILVGKSGTAPAFDPHVAQGNVIKCDRTGNLLHPTQKPVELIEKLLTVSKWADVIVDPFAGSGTTLMACETLGRSCRAIEMSPGFCHVIIDRWEAFTGQKAVQS